MCKQILLLMTALLISSTGWTQTCDTETISASTPSSRFISGNGATVIDVETTLSWMRCSIGQQWNGSQCGGEPTIVSWQQAMTLVEKINQQNFDGHHDWRMPMIPELATIVEFSVSIRE